MNRLKISVILTFLLGQIVLGQQGAKYLIIAYDPYVPILQPLAQWKTQKGILAKVVPVSQVGTTPIQIQSYIRNAYNNWPIKPEYVLLAGSPSQIPSYNGTTDCYYGDMTGDYKMEISVGRFYVTNARECSTLVAKTVAYERSPVLPDSLWYKSIVTCVREDNAADDTLYWGDSRLLHQFCLLAGYVHIDSFSKNRGNGSGDVTAAANSGRSFITYRGQGVGTWWDPFNAIDPFSWTNREKMPIVIGATCATISLESGGGNSMYGDKFVRAGTPGTLGGAIAYFGTTGIVSHGAHYRSACYRGFFTAIFAENQYHLGPATLRGRFWIDSLYHDQTRYQEWNLLGDPELGVWTDIPHHIEVYYDSVIPIGPQTFRIEVVTDGQPVAGALVCCSMDSSMYVTGVTDSAGCSYLEINPGHIGSLDVVVSGRNLIPYEGNCRVIAGGIPYLIISGITIDDSTGSNDRVINPGERIVLYFALKNAGEATATGVTAVFRSSSPHIALIDSIAYFNSIEPDSVRTGDGVEFIVDSLSREGTVISATLLVRDADNDSWRLPANLTIRAGKIVIDTALFIDSAPYGNGNGVIGSSESGPLYIAISNLGGGNLRNMQLTLTCLDSNVAVGDSQSYFGTVNAGESKSGDRDPFALSVSPYLPKNKPLIFKITIHGQGETYPYTDTVSISLAGEMGTVSDPSGPDSYGYWCYDDSDTVSGRAPIYSWVELAPPGPGIVIPAVSDSDAVTRTLRLPFQFKFYGRVDTIISVCSNGFLALGYTTYRSGNNRPIPDTVGPPLMICPFWDDLNPDENRNGYGTAYQYFDSINRRYYIEFKDFAHYNQPNIRETFQIILFDPSFYPTRTGDGEIVFQYQQVALNSSCTVGIEDSSETTGIQYLYNNIYHPNGAYLQSHRALRYTTNAPLSVQAPWLILAGVFPSDNAHGNGNGFWEPGESLEIFVTLLNRGLGSATNTVARLIPCDRNTSVYDSVAQFGTILPESAISNEFDPFHCIIDDGPSDSIAVFRLQISADGYNAILFFTLGITGCTGYYEEGTGKYATRLLGIIPNLVKTTTRIYYSLGSQSDVEFTLIDVSGRVVRTVRQKSQVPGLHALGLSLTNLPVGAYFCKLCIKEGHNEKIFIGKILCIH
ncbi:MAG: C25 family cysteine peptidase [candidate division WOR-3 bacterium]